MLGLFYILNMRKLSRIEEKELTMLVEKYGADQLLQEGINKKKLATLIGAGILAGTSLTDLPRNCNSDKEPLKTEYSNPYGINDVDYENILNKQRLVREYISKNLKLNGKSIKDLRFNPDNLVLAAYKYEYDLPLLLAQLQIESHFGTTNRAKATNSMFSIGSYDDGRNVVKYADQDSSIVPYIKTVKRDFFMNGEKDVEDVLTNFVNKEGKRYAINPNYERDIMKTRDSIIRKYPGLLSDYVCLD